MTTSSVGTKVHLASDSKARPLAIPVTSGQDGDASVWHALLGALDLAGLQMLQTLFDATRTHGTEVRRWRARCTGTAPSSRGILE
jgi:hypothetical protein